MNRRHWLSMPFLVGALASPWLTNCAGGFGLPAVPGITPECPEGLSKIAEYDFAGQFQLDADVAAKIKSGLLASLELKGFAESIDKDVRQACSGIAADLGGPTEFKTTEEACAKAGALIGETKGKLGSKAKVSFEFTPPECGASMSAMVDCAGRCDASLKGGNVEATCEGGQLQGTCEGECRGTCAPNAAVKCEGTCAGSCEVDVKAKCTGTCEGKCNGKASSGAECKGICQGKCQTKVDKQECKGTCSGKCDIKGAAKCEGTCTGDCSVKMQAPRCTGEVRPPSMRAECKASCDTSAQLHAQCSDPRVHYRIVGASDADAAKKLQATIEKNIPVIVKLAIGLKDRIRGATHNVKQVIEGGISAGETFGNALSSDLQAKARSAALVACLTPLKGALDAAGSLSVSVEVSVKVEGSVSAGTQ